jgi:GntP family gluconate:H+ symporter
VSGTLVAAIVGLPMFFEVGFVMLVPLVLQLARRAGHPVLRVGIPVMAGLATVHALVPPHPGPLFAIDAVHASVGLTLLYGLVIAVPTAIVAGPLFTAYIWPRVKAEIPAGELAAFTSVPDRSSTDRESNVATTATDSPFGTASTPQAGAGVRSRADAGVSSTVAVPEVAMAGDSRRLPRFSVTLGTILLPIILMLMKAVADTFHVLHGRLYTTIEFLGTPVVALLLTLLVSLVTLGYGIGASRAHVHDSLRRSFPPVASVLVIVAAGGGYSQALQDSGVDASIDLASQHLHIPLLLLAWIIAALMRTVVGSGTVATVAAAGIVTPLAQGLTPSYADLLALALGSGAAFLGHVNDAGFWMFKEYFGLSVGGTLRTWTVAHTLLSLTSLAAILLLSVLVA